MLRRQLPCEPGSLALYITSQPIHEERNEDRLESKPEHNHDACDKFLQRSHTHTHTPAAHNANKSAIQKRRRKMQHHAETLRAWSSTRINPGTQSGWKWPLPSFHSRTLILWNTPTRNSLNWRRRLWRMWTASLKVWHRRTPREHTSNQLSLAHSRKRLAPSYVLRCTEKNCTDVTGGWIHREHMTQRNSKATSCREKVQKITAVTSKLLL